MPRTSISRCASCPARSRSSHKSSAAQRQPSLFENTTIYESRPTPQIRKLREAIAQYLCLDDLRDLATRGEDIRSILRSGEPVPEEVQALVSLLSALLSPVPGETIRSPADIAALLMTEMGCLDHEEFWVVCLDTANQVQRIIPLYRGTLNSAAVRVAEVFRPAISLGSASVIVAHNHPSGRLEVSPEDIDTTCNLRQAGTLLQIELLDHLIIAQGRWLSLREQRPLDW
jgi:DNA repair protein RadC